MEFRILRCWGCGEGDYVADVCHAGNEEHQTLESEAEARVGHSAEAAGVEVPPHIFHRYIEFFDTSEEFVVVGFALATADDFTDFGEEYVHGANGAAVVVLLHIEGLDILGIVGEDNGLAEVLLYQVALVLALEVDAPFNGNFEFRPEAFVISMPSV